jgi:hypothetical protein
MQDQHRMAVAARHTHSPVNRVGEQQAELGSREKRELSERRCAKRRRAEPEERRCIHFATVQIDVTRAPPGAVQPD